MINFCSAQELMVLPRVGKKIAKTVVKFRDFTGNITPDNIFDINKLNLSDEVLNMIDFTPNVDYDKRRQFQELFFHCTLVLRKTGVSVGTHTSRSF